MEFIKNLYLNLIDIKPEEVSALLYMLKIVLIYAASKPIRILFLKVLVHSKLLKVPISSNDNLLRGYYRHIYGFNITMLFLILLGLYLRFWGLKSIVTSHLSFNICVVLVPIVFLIIDLDLILGLESSSKSYKLKDIREEYDALLSDISCFDNKTVKNMLLNTNMEE
jgi:hypothetical protein